MSIFSEELEKCTKAEDIFKLILNVIPVFNPKRKIPFAAMESIITEPDRLENCRVIYKIDYSEWATHSVYIWRN